MPDRRFSFVTVAFGGDAGAMGLQARSLALHAPRDLLAQIIVIENVTDGVAMAWRPRLLAEYGRLADLVVFKTADEVASLPASTEGWWSQQVLKLEIARQVATPAYLLLDGKHHLVKPLARSFLEDASGRLRIRCADYEGHPLTEYFDRSLRYFGLNPAEHRHYFPTTTPPFPMDTAIVLELIELSRTKDGSLADLMISRRLTEFFLYSAFLAATDRLDTLYDRHDMAYPMIWAGQHDDATCNRLLSVSASGESPFFGLHRKAAPLLSPQASAEISDYWVRCGLFDTQSAAAAYLNELRAANRPQRVGRLARVSARIRQMVGSA